MNGKITQNNWLIRSVLKVQRKGRRIAGGGPAGYSQDTALGWRPAERDVLVFSSDPITGTIPRI